MNCHFLIAVLVGAFSLIGCSTQSVLEETNSHLKDIRSSNLKIQAQGDTPSLEGLSRTSYTIFHSGNIIQTDYLEQVGLWYKIRITERVIVNENDNSYIDIVRSGWVNSISPEIVYSSDELSNKNISNQTVDDNTSFLAKSSTLSSTPKKDLLSQKEVDQLLAADATHFDGLTFKGKDFRYANFSRGSFRGTRFEDSNLSHVLASSNSQENTSMFKDTLVRGGEHKNITFNNWSIDRSQFSGLTLIEPQFIDTTIGTSIGNHLTFRETVIDRAKFVSTRGGRGIFRNVSHYNVTYTAPKFESVDIFGGVHFTTTFVNPIIIGGKWSGVVFNNVQAPPSRIQGGFFKNVEFVNGDMKAIIIEKLGLSYPKFESTSLKWTDLSNAKISAWFRNSSSADGGAKFINTDFQDSIFEDFQFGEEIGSRVDLRNADFSGVEFRGSNKFINCNVGGAKFPANIQNVTFSNCIGM